MEESGRRGEGGSAPSPARLLLFERPSALAIAFALKFERPSALAIEFALSGKILEVPLWSKSGGKDAGRLERGDHRLAIPCSVAGADLGLVD